MMFGHEVESDHGVALQQSVDGAFQARPLHGFDNIMAIHFNHASPCDPYGRGKEKFDV